MWCYLVVCFTNVGPRFLRRIMLLGVLIVYRNILFISVILLQELSSPLVSFKSVTVADWKIRDTEYMRLIKRSLSGDKLCVLHF